MLTDVFYFAICKKNILRNCLTQVNCDWISHSIVDKSGEDVKSFYVHLHHSQRSMKVSMHSFFFHFLWYYHYHYISVYIYIYIARHNFVRFVHSPLWNWNRACSWLSGEVGPPLRALHPWPRPDPLHTASLCPAQLHLCSSGFWDTGVRTGQ